MKKRWVWIIIIFPGEASGLSWSSSTQLAPASSSSSQSLGHNLHHDHHEHTHLHPYLLSSLAEFNIAGTSIFLPTSTFRRGSAIHLEKGTFTFLPGGKWKWTFMKVKVEMFNKWYYHYIRCIPLSCQEEGLEEVVVEEQVLHAACTQAAVPPGFQSCRFLHFLSRP